MIMKKWLNILLDVDDMTYEEAADFISYNSSYYYGEGYPIILYSCEE